MAIRNFFLGHLFVIALVFGCESNGDENNSESSAVDGPSAIEDTPTDEMAASAAPAEEAPIYRFESVPDRFGLPEVSEGVSAQDTVRLTNTGNRPISVSGIEFTMSGPAQLLYGYDQRPPVILYSYAGDDLTDSVLPLEIPPTGVLRLEVQHRGSGMATPTGEVRVTGNFEESPLVLAVEAGGRASRVTVSPMELDFERVRARPNNSRENLPAVVALNKTLNVNVSNQGEQVLEVSGLELRGGGSSKFSLALNGADPLVDPQVFEDPDGDGSPGLAAGGAFELQVTYTPTRETPDRSEIIFDTSDPEVREVRIPLRGNSVPGCVDVEVDPPADAANTLELIANPGETVTGRILVSACGENPLTLDLIRMRPGSASALSFDDSDLPVFPAILSAIELPYEFLVSYTAPAQVRTEYRGALQVLNNSTNDHSLGIEVIGITPCSDDSVCEGMGQIFRCEQGRCAAVPPEELPPDTPLP